MDPAINSPLFLGAMAIVAFIRVIFPVYRGLTGGTSRTAAHEIKIRVRPRYRHEDGPIVADGRISQHGRIS